MTNVEQEIAFGDFGRLQYFATACHQVSPIFNHQVGDVSG
jgi:hypothetical protein